jgi:biotin synthase-related radical SAM superfamily protein
MGNHFKRPREQDPRTISVVAYKRESKHDLMEVRKLLKRTADLIDVTLEVSK